MGIEPFFFSVCKFFYATALRSFVLVQQLIFLRIAQTDMQPTVTDLLMLCKHDTVYPADTVSSFMQHYWRFLFRKKKKKKKKKRDKLWRCTSLNTTQLWRKEASRPQN